MGLDSRATLFQLHAAKGWMFSSAANAILDVMLYMSGGRGPLRGARMPMRHDLLL
jgi:hypothetical protein